MPATQVSPRKGVSGSHCPVSRSTRSMSTSAAWACGDASRVVASKVPSKSVVRNMGNASRGMVRFLQRTSAAGGVEAAAGYTGRCSNACERNTVFMAAQAPRTRVLTGITTSGTPHLGNYVGAIRPAVAASLDPQTESFYFLADYH